jgi:hypothetical protein
MRSIKYRAQRPNIFLLREIPSFSAFPCRSLAFLNRTWSGPGANRHRARPPNQRLVANDSREKRVDAVRKNRPGQPAASDWSRDPI